ncbi:MAG: ABC transporter ATP-binding protein [Piscinibacter sp.]|nr:ABC transporter ATP-binding protein [Piscinibacter sp.]
MGKTTTVKTIMGQLPARQGAMRLAGADITRLADWRVARAGIGLVPEGRAIFPNLSVRENLICGAANRHRSLEPWTLERVYATFPRLQEREGNLGANLSGGEQQMLAIGRALMTNPLLLILDEATEGLAPLIRKEIWNCLGGLKQTGLSMLVIDKNLKALCQIADHHYVLEKGHVVWQGSTEALKADWAQVQVHVGV